jgi:hypothetical protein
VCIGCHQGLDAAAAAPPIRTVDPGVPGASARREYELRSSKREARIRTAHPHLGGLILAVSGDPSSTTSWASGARGEEVLGAGLERLADRGVRVLHDRRMPRSRANIDHITVGPGGVHVIDTKRYADKRPTRRVEGWLFGRRVEKLYVGGRDRSSLVVGVHKQVAVVVDALTDAGLEGVPVRGVLCFVDGRWPLIGGDFRIGGVDVLWPKKLGDRLLAKEPILEPAAIEAAHRVLATALSPA